MRGRRGSAIVMLAIAALGMAIVPGVRASDTGETAPMPTVRYVLRPVDGGGEIRALDVSIEISGAAGGPQQALFTLPLVSWNVPTVAAALPRLAARDERGSFALQASDEGEDEAKLRHWFPERRTVGKVTLGYSVPPVSADAPRGAAPPVEPRAEAGAISGGAAIVLLRPASAQAHFSIEWDLGALPPGSAGLHSPMPPPREAQRADFLDEVYYMAGRLDRYPTAAVADGFFAAWQGEPPFAARALMQWTAELYGHYEKFFGTAPAPYGVFMRRNPVNAGGGMGMHRSFIVTFGEDRGNDPGELKLTLAHEMFHTFQPMLTAGEAEGGQLAASWFNEGLATYYQRTLPLRFGLLDAAAFLADLNFHAGRYYTSAMANVPNSQVAANFWKDTRIRTLPYDRGFLYFATVDESMRRASSGQRSLDDLMLAMKRLERSAGRPIVRQDWADLLQHELGAQAVDEFERVLAGGTPLPSSEAFGPCFRRVAKPLRRYELGFEPAVLTESPRRVRGLVPGSAAQAAGLREGDIILKPVPQDQIQGEQTGLLTLSIRRGDESTEITYLPRGETVEAWQWERVPGDTSAACAL